MKCLKSMNATVKTCNKNKINGGGGVGIQIGSPFPFLLRDFALTLLCK